MTVTRHSALWPTIVAMIDAIAAASSLSSLLAGDRAYNTTAPPDAQLDYVIVSNPAESDDSVFGQPGTAGIIQIDIWCSSENRLGNGRVLAIYDALVGLFHKQSLVVSGWRYVIGSLALITVIPDEDGKSTHGIANFTITQRQS